MKAIGTQAVNGVQTTHYAGTVSTDDQLAHYSGAVRSQMQAEIAKTGWTGTKIDVWLDAKGLVSPYPPSQVADLGWFAGAGTS